MTTKTEGKPMTDRDRIVQALSARPGMTSTAIAVATGLPNDSRVSSHLHAMVVRGQVTRSRERPYTYSVVPGWVPMRERWADKPAVVPTMNSVARALFSRPTGADLMAADADAREAAERVAEQSAGMAAASDAAAQDKAGVPAPENPVSVPADLARVLSRPGSSAAGHAVRPATPSGAVPAAPEGGPDDTSGRPVSSHAACVVPVASFLMDDEARLTIDLGDEVIAIGREDTARLYALLYRFGDALL